MADIRQSQAILDDFNRADENPLSGGGNWAQVMVPGTNPLQLIDGDAFWNPSISSQSYWTPLTMDDDDCEVWAQPTGGNQPSIAWGIGLMRDAGTSTADGYLFRSEVDTAGAKWRFYKCTNGTYSLLHTIDPGGLTGGQDGKMCLIRRNGNDIECWYDNTGQTPPTFVDFSLIHSFTDTDYMTDMYGFLEIFGNDTAWDRFGAGANAQPVSVPQIIRRTHRRGGYWYP